MTDRERLEMAEARELVRNYLANGSSKIWLEKAMKTSVRIYGRDSEQRIRTYMRIIWKDELCK